MDTRKRAFSAIVCTLMLCIMLFPATAAAAPTAPTVGDGVSTPKDLSHSEVFAASHSRWPGDEIS